MESFEIDPVVRLANETRRRGQMLVVTDRASWRVDYCGALNEIGMFRLFRCSKGQSDFQEQSQTFPGDPTGMRAVRAHIESQDVQALGGDPRSWCIHFTECEGGSSAWTLPCQLRGSHLQPAYSQIWKRKGSEAPPAESAVHYRSRPTHRLARHIIEDAKECGCCSTGHLREDLALYAEFQRG